MLRKTFRGVALLGVLLVVALFLASGSALIGEENHWSTSQGLRTTSTESGGAICWVRRSSSNQTPSPGYPFARRHRDITAHLGIMPTIGHRHQVRTEHPHVRMTEVFSQAAGLPE